MTEYQPVPPRPVPPAPSGMKRPPVPPMPPRPVPPGMKRPPAPPMPPHMMKAPPPAYAHAPAPAPIEEDYDDEDASAVQDEREEGPYDDNMAASLGLPPVFIKTKMLMFIFCLMLGIGFAAGFVFSKTVKTGGEELPGVVTNPEIPKGRPRCGLGRKGQGCVMYVMNPSIREMNAKEFFPVVADLLKMPKFQVETANVQYSTTRIPPGYIGLFNVPPAQ